MQTIQCTVHYPEEKKKFTVIFDDKKTPLDLTEEFQSQIVQSQNKITFIFKQIALKPNIPFQDQGVKNNDTILMNVEREGGRGGL